MRARKLPIRSPSFLAGELLQKLLINRIQCHTCGHRYIQRVLHPELRDLNGCIDLRQQKFGDAGNLVAQNQAYFRRGGFPGVDRDARVGLLEPCNDIPGFLQRRDFFGRISDLPPFHMLFGADGGFCDFGAWRDRGVARQPEFLNPECIGRTKGGAHVMQAADVVKPEDEVFPKWRIALKVFFEDLPGCEFFQGTYVGRLVSGQYNNIPGSMIAVDYSLKSACCGKGEIQLYYSPE